MQPADRVMLLRHRESPGGLPRLQYTAGTFIELQNTDLRKRDRTARQPCCPRAKDQFSRGRLLQADVQNKLPVPRLTVPGQSSKASSAISVSSDKTAMFCRE